MVGKSREFCKSINKRTRGCIDCSTQPLIFSLKSKRRSVLFLRWRFSHVHVTHHRFFVSRRCSRRVVSGQHTICINKLLVFLSNHCADRFLLWWLFLHRRLRSRQRGSLGLRQNERLLLFSPVVPCRKVFPVFIRKTLERIFQLFREPSLSASIQGVNSNFFPSFVTLKRCVTAPLASPCTGRKPVSIFDCIWSLHPFFFKSSRKYLRFCAYFIALFNSLCGKLFRLPVEKTVENPASILMSLFKFFKDFGDKENRLCKSIKKGLKKIFEAANLTKK